MKQRITEGRATGHGRGDGMSREDLILAEPIAATEAIPEELLREFQRFDGVERGGEQGLIRAADLPATEGPGIKGRRPPWLAQTTLPRMAPALRPAATLRALAGRALPMTLLSHPSTEVFDRSYPWCTIGRVFAGTAPEVSDANWMNLWTTSGTGTLVGRNLMVTASHVAPWGQGPGRWWMRFVPSYWGAITGDGFTEPFGGSFVESFTGVQFEGEVGGRDVVVCKLYRPLGDLTGWMGRWRWFSDDAYRNWPHTSVGYPGNPYQGARPVVQTFVAVEDVDHDGDGLELETIPFTSPGWSGGPLFFWRNGAPLVVGVASGREEDFDFWEFFSKTSSVFAGGPRLLDLIAFGEANWS